MSDIDTRTRIKLLLAEVRRLEKELAKAQAEHKALSDTFRCFKCGDNSTPLYCLNCGGEIAVEELAKAQADVTALRSEIHRMNQQVLEQVADNVRLASLLHEYDEAVDELSHHWATHRNEYDRFDLVQQKITRLRAAREGK